MFELLLSGMSGPNDTALGKTLAYDVPPVVTGSAVIPVDVVNA